MFSSFRTPRSGDPESILILMFQSKAKWIPACAGMTPSNQVCFISDSRPSP
jgi:hypothetical protein